MDKIQRTAALKVFLNLAAITLIVIGVSAAIQLLGLQVVGIMLVAGVLVMLIKTMYEHEVDRARRLDELNNRDGS